MVPIKEVPPEEFVKFLDKCDRDGYDPFTIMKRHMHGQIDSIFVDLEEKYRTGRAGKTWPDVASEVWKDTSKKVIEATEKTAKMVYDGYDQLTKEAADWYYGNR